MHTHTHTRTPANGRRGAPAKHMRERNVCAGPNKTRTNPCTLAPYEFCETDAALTSAVCVYSNQRARPGPTTANNHQ